MSRSRLQSQWEAILTKRDQVPIVVQHHVPLGRIQLPPLLRGKVHGHVLECHGCLRHKIYFCSPSFTRQHPFHTAVARGPGAEGLNILKWQWYDKCSNIFRFWIPCIKSLVSVMCHACSARFNMRTKRNTTMVSPLRDYHFSGEELKIKHEPISWQCSLAK